MSKKRLFIFYYMLKLTLCLNSLGSNVLSRPLYPVFWSLGWVPAYLFIRLPFFIHILGTSTSWLLHTFWKHFFSFTKSYRCFPCSSSFTSQNDLEVSTPLFMIFIQAHKEVFARLLPPGLIFLLSLDISMITIFLNLDWWVYI